MDDESLRVKAVLVVHRHGDRSPGINLFVSSPLERVEHQFWSDRVPHRDAPSVPASRFPAPHASKIGEAFDDDNYPFSLLSQAGQSQLFALGQRLRARYGQLIRAPDDVHVRSTNYRRTIDSARFALKGLVGDALSVPIHVGGEGDPLNPWKYNPGIAQGARMMRKSPTVVKAEAAAQATKEALVKRFPLYQARPELFSWVAVADYFVTRECYDSALVLDGVEACREAALDMMALQFLSFYKDVALRGMVVGPLVHGVHAWLAAKAGAPALKTDGAHPLLFDPAASVVVVSGHDQTLLPLMCALQIQRGDSYRSAWPLYASSLAFELLERASDGTPHVRIVFDDGKGKTQVLVPACLPHDKAASGGAMSFQAFTDVVLSSAHARM